MVQKLLFLVSVSTALHFATAPACLFEICYLTLSSSHPKGQDCLALYEEEACNTDVGVNARRVKHKD